MKNILIWIFNFGLIISVSAQNNKLLKLWYEQPAKQWVEALPVGNGRLGAMIYGDPFNEIIQLNENTLWTGSPNRNDNPGAKEALPEVRKLVFEGKYNEAQDLVNREFISKTSQGMAYQTVGNLKLSFPGHENYTGFYRELDLEKAVVSSSYEVKGIKYETSVFSSFPDQIIVIQIKADKPGSVTFSASMDRPEPSKINVSADEEGELTMTGITSEFEKLAGSIKFAARVKIVAQGGKVSAYGTSLSVTNADVATLYISIATNFINYHDLSANAEEKVSNYLLKASKKSYDQILSDHISDFQNYFNRVKLDLGESPAVKKPTDVRLAGFAKGNDPQFVALYFQFGRYLLISASRPGGQPANLQGIWNDQLAPPWDSKYTVNINTEMNYWPSEVANMSEMNEPLIQMVRELSETGKQTARDMYGAGGWVLHHNTDIWRINGPVDGSFWGQWPMGGAWLSQHLFNKYTYSGDVEYLKSIYPVLKGSSEFFLDFLVEEPEHKWLVVCPSVSPENAPAHHPQSSISAGTTMDNQLVFDLFSITVKAALILNTDKDLIAKINEAIKRLAPMQIGKWGQLQEWMYDWDNPQDKHRHVSHLYGLYPSNQISPYHHPELFVAARTSLLARGDESTGWSMGWKVNLWARLLDGDHAFKLIMDQLTPAIQPGGKQKGGTYPNLFDAHPPFQIDGNFGCTSGIAEMLMQSHDGAIHILPALPDEWKKGEVSGLRTRGGFEVSFRWENGRVQKIEIKSKLGGNCRIRVPNEVVLAKDNSLKPASGTNPNPFFETANVKNPVISENAKLNKVALPSTQLYDLPTEAGKTYSIVIK